MTRLAVPAALLALFSVVLALGFLAYTSNQDLSDSRARLATANTALTSTQVQLASETQTRTVAQGTVDTLTSKVAELQSELSRQTACTTELAGEIAELESIHASMTTNFNLFAKGSKFAAARVARDKALNAALTDYYNAYSAAFDRSLTTANSWIRKGNAQISIAAAKIKVMNAQVDTADLATAAIETSISAFASHIVATKGACSAAGTT